MKNFIEKLIPYFIAIVLIYGCCVFITLEFNPLDWCAKARFLSSGAFACLFVIYITQNDLF